MELITLHKSQYTSVKLVENYTSLIWTERQTTPGEFVLKTYDVDGIAALLPEDTFVSLADTRVVMQVHTHSIDLEGEGADEVEVLTVTGIEVTDIINHRWVESGYKKKRKMRRRYSASAALCVLLFNAVDNGSGKDVTRGDPDPFTDYLTKPGQTIPDVPEQNDFSWNLLDKLPNIAITENVTVEPGGRWWMLEQGILGPQFQKIIDDSGFGFQALRPVSSNSGVVVTVKTGLSERGEIVRTPTSNITSLTFNIYQGVDRSASVKFSHLRGDLDKQTYLTSKKDYKTGVEVISGTVAINDVYRNGEADLTGWERRIAGLDAGEPEIPKEPEKPDELKDNATAEQKKKRREQMDKWIDAHAKWRNKRDNIIADFKEESIAEARKILSKGRRVRMFGADISPEAPYVYGKDYNLGDLITLNGDHGYSVKMVVSEFVRTEDANGERGLPGLVEP